MRSAASLIDYNTQLGFTKEFVGEEVSGAGVGLDEGGDSLAEGTVPS